MASVRARKSLPPRPRFVLPLLLAAPLLAAPSSTALEVIAHARAMVPGEPVRIVVRSPERLSGARATFLGADVPLVRVAASTEAWCGFATIDLDRGPGTAAIEVTGTTANGEVVSGSLAVTVEAKKFPEQRLKVDEKFVSPPPAAQKRIEREKKMLDEVYATRTDRVPPAAPFVRPVPGQPSSPYGSRRVFNGVPKSPHSGLDLRAAAGDPVKAAGAGRVRLSQDLYYSGNTVILDHGAGLFTVYAHLSRLGVKEGDEVEAGGEIGRVGATGRVTGPHLHWGAKVGDRPFDPSALLDPALFR
jgi:murein DD-endopeptidase MepM/ murein hydrolase activator NlpD